MILQRFKRVLAAPAAVVPLTCAFEWREAGGAWREELSWKPQPGGTIARSLENGRPLRVPFEPPSTYLDRFEVVFGTFRRRNVGQVVCSLLHGNVTVATGTVDLEDITDNAFHRLLDLEGIAFVNRRQYALELRLDAAPGNEIAVYVPARAGTNPGRRRQLLKIDQQFRQGSVVVEGMLPRYRLEWEANEARWATWPTVSIEDTAGYEAHRFKAGEAFGFEIVAPASAVDLSVQLATYQRRVDGFLATEIRDRDGEVMAWTALDLATVMDNQFAPLLSIGANVLQPGRKYRVRLHWFGSEAEPVALYAARIAPGRYELKRHLIGLDVPRLFSERAWRKSATPSPKVTIVASEALLDVPGLLAGQLSRAFPDVRYDMVAFAQAATELDRLRGADVVVFVDTFDLRAASGLSFDELCFDLHRNRVCTIFLDAEERTTVGPGMRLPREAAVTLAHRRTHARRCHYVLAGTALSPSQGKLRLSSASRALDADALRNCVKAVRTLSSPHVCVISVLHRKAATIESFLDHVFAQTYPGLITVVLVDDASPDAAAALAEERAKHLAMRDTPSRRVVIRRNPSNLGNCGSRLAGLSAEEADLYVVIDCDCLINRDFVAAHVFEHWWDDVDAVVGPLNVESEDRDAPTLVAALQADAVALARESRLQDPVLPEAFVNCITRNFSVKRRRVAEEALFDVDFSYSAKPDSGFGWEDVEMGYRLYDKGAVIRFTPHAFSVHISHASSMAEGPKILGSSRNFARLFSKHPELPLVSRRWATDTYDNIVRWQDREGLVENPARPELDALFSGSQKTLSGLMAGLRGERRRLRILTYRWHAPHQYELYKLPHDFFLVTGLGSPATDVWSYDQRPLRPNARFVPMSGVDPRDYDLALLHFDENVLAAHVCNGIIPASWGDAFRRLVELPGLPKVAICHGTVPFEGQFGLVPDQKTHFVTHEDERVALRVVLAQAGVHVVCNSHQAQAEWGFAQSSVIWHGFDPQEFPRGTLDRDVLALAADYNRPHYRGAWEFDAVVRDLEGGIKVETAAHAGAAIEMRDRNAYAIRNFRSYIDRIGSFKFYLNTTLRSPMPRSRGEAMMTGVIPICMRNHDVDRFIENGVDGFYADRPEDLATFINDAVRDPARLRAMSRAARLKAMDVFNHDRYLAAWSALLDRYH